MNITFGETGDTEAMILGGLAGYDVEVKVTGGMRPAFDARVVSVGKQGIGYERLSARHQGFLLWNIIESIHIY